MGNKAHSPGHAIELRRGTVERVHSAGGQYFKITGLVEVVGPGEATINVNFPVRFVDRPAFSFGPELAPGQPIAYGSLPTCTVVVLLWDQIVRQDQTTVYTGAEFGIVSTGPSDQVLYVQWHVEGVGLQGPADEDQ